MMEISKKKLAILLSKLRVFDKPDIKAEQYPMDSEIGADVLWNAYQNGDILGKVSADLGSGTGILGIGMLILGTTKTYFVDKDEGALEVAKKNHDNMKSEADISGKALFEHREIKDFDKKCDTIVMNPPFGVKVRHQDRAFLDKAFQAADTIYCFHKSESKGFIDKYSEDNGFKVSHCYDYEFPIKASYHFHSKRIKRVKVSCSRMINKKVFK